MRYLFFAILVAASLRLAADDNWPQFRGPTSDGHVSAGKLPLTWHDSPNKESKHILWKTPIHDRGWSSPVVWGDQIWLTTSTADGHQLYAVCVDRETGKVTHDIRVFEVDEPDHLHPTNSYASPSPVVDEHYVYVHFGTNGSACLKRESGDIVWTRRDLNCNHEQGAGSSPMLIGNLFVVHVDGRDVQYIIALDKTTGRTVWKSNRSIDYSRYEEYQRKGYCMPIAVPRGNGQQLISSGPKGLFSYDVETGKELWKVRHEGWSMTPRPLYSPSLGLVFAVIDYDHPQLWAVRPDGNGDVTDSHVEWKVTKAIPSRPSFILIHDLLFLVNSDGLVSCLDAKTGDSVWKERIENKYSASPIYCDGRIYFFNENSVTTVIRADRRFDVLAVNWLADEQLMASPAASGNSIFIRTERHLYRIDDSVSRR